MEILRFLTAMIAVAMLFAGTTDLSAHEGGHPVAADQAGGADHHGETEMPETGEHFKAFESSLQLRWDNQFLYVGSNGMPDHPMMIGIRSWQQQVPIPQKYYGDNAWRIPLHPVPAKQPMSTKNDFLRGAIALAVNGVPIFNPLNNRGDDALLFGELDEYGGHCGRADDYHYHTAPVHLEKITGKDKPIAYALDGYPILGYQDPQDADYAPLDKWGGHKDASGNYHYHATKTYPYLNGGFYGEVTKRDGQVDPQPRAEPLRPALQPLRDATITGFDQTQPGSYRLAYEVRGKQGVVAYHLAEDGSATFRFVDPNGDAATETYSPGRRGPGRDGGPPREGGPPRGDGPPRDGPRPGSPAPDVSSMSHPDPSGFAVTSASVDEKGFVSVDCTCDGDRQSPAVAWKDAPQGTQAFAVSVWHTAPDQEKSYWVVYNIPADVTELAQDSKGVGTVGLNDKQRAEYDPMCSKGPGLKKYHVTVYALSVPLRLPAKEVTRTNLLRAIDGVTLGEATLDFLYER